MGRLTVLEQIAQDIAAEFGNDCEVVIHDLKTKEPEHSIIYIVNGHITGRRKDGEVTVLQPTTMVT